MIVVGAVYRAAVACSVVSMASGVYVPCPAGTRVYSLSVWSGGWLDGLYMRCTGGSEQHAIPAEFNEDPGGDAFDGICAGTGGVHSIAWDIPSDSGHLRMVHGNITCLDDATSFFADRIPYNELGVNGSRSVSCQEGEHVHGLTYDIEYEEDSNTPYFLTYIGLMCSTSALDPICTDCGSGKKLMSGEDQPEFCKSPTCTEAECCQTDHYATKVAVSVILGCGLAVLAIGGLFRWGYEGFRDSIGSCNWWTPTVLDDAPAAPRG